MAFDERAHLRSQMNGAEEKITFWEDRAFMHRGGKKPCPQCVEDQKTGGNGCSKFWGSWFKADPHRDSFSQARRKLWLLDQADAKERGKLHDILEAPGGQA